MPQNMPDTRGPEMWLDAACGSLTDDGSSHRSIEFIQ
jgi:hypothetical protein